MTEPLDSNREEDAAEHSVALLRRQPEHHLVNRILCAPVNMSTRKHTQAHMFAETCASASACVSLIVLLK